MKKKQDQAAIHFAERLLKENIQRHENQIEQESLNSIFLEIHESLNEIKEDTRILKARMVSLESWMAALSKGKDLHRSHTFAKDITDLHKRLNPPAISIDHCNQNISPVTFEEKP